MAIPRVWPGYTLVQALPTIVGMFAVGFCASAFLLLIRAMVADVVDEVRLEQSRDLTSLLYSMVTTTTKIGATIIGGDRVPGAGAGRLQRQGRRDQHASRHLRPGDVLPVRADHPGLWFGGAMLFGYKLDAKRHGAICTALAEREAHVSIAAAEEFPGRRPAASVTVRPLPAPVARRASDG